MTANLRFIAHSAETDSHKFAAQRVGDRLAETGFSYAGWPEKTEDCAVSLRIEFSHGQVFDQPLLYLFQIVVIAIKHLLRLFEIKIIVAQFVPWQIGEDLQVGPFRTPPEIVTTYRHEPDLGIDVPAEMQDWYPDGRGDIRGVATYGRFRRFQVKTEETIK